MSWVKFTRPDGQPVWLNSTADYWRIIGDPEDPDLFYIWCGDVCQEVLETPKQIMDLLK